VPTAVSSDDFVAAFAKAFCDAMERCCTNAGIAVDHASCMTNLTRDGEHFLNSPPLRKYDPVRAGKCVDEARSQLSLCRTTRLKDLEFTEACKAIYAGTVAPGGACQSNRDCAEASNGPMRCEVDVTNPVPPAPICVLDPLGKLGEPCLGSAPYEPGVRYPHFACADPLYCDVTNHCQPQHGEGGDCSPAVLCESTLWCHSTGPTTGACERRLEPGSPCTYDAQCSSSTFCYEAVCTDGTSIGPAQCGGV
jgi:hypothetical protein